MGFLDIFKVSAIKKENIDLKKQNDYLNQRLNDLGVNEYDRLQKETLVLKNNVNAYNQVIAKLNAEITALKSNEERVSLSVEKEKKKLVRTRELYNSFNYAIENYVKSEFPLSAYRVPENDLQESEGITPSVILQLHCMDLASLKKAYNENTKVINSVLKKYSSRYTTKANKAIYQLMVIALRAELQNILVNLKYQKIDKAIEDVKTVTQKYLKIATDGNQSITPTLTRFIGEVEYLFINQVKIEYNYYVKKEQARQEQLSIRQQMREEAEERKLLEQQKKQIEKEESKYLQEIEKSKKQLESSNDPSTVDKLKARILELESQLSDVIVKKDEITKLQNGKAGNVYVISNLGSFGDNVFKVGMTRRINPQDRINELSDASVPFKFDVHSFIFSNNAVELEKKLHEILESKRLNKVNRRKEFFKVSIDEIEAIVHSIEPTAEFTQTMMAEEFKQSLSSSFSYTDSISMPDDFFDDSDYDE